MLNRVTQAELVEAITQVMLYSGWPRGMAAMCVAKTLFTEGSKGNIHMEIQPQNPTTLNPTAQFPGQVWLDPIAIPQTDNQRTTTARVRFAPGARTAWHHHARGQFLYVTEGIARFGSRGIGITDVHPGQTIYFAPGEERFHASGGGLFMEHIAILEAADNPSDTTVWLEQISDDDYNGIPTS